MADRVNRSGKRMGARAWYDRVGYLVGSGTLRQALQRASFEPEAIDLIVEILEREVG